MVAAWGSGATRDAGFDIREAYGGRINLGLYLVDALHPGDDLDARGCEQLARDKRPRPRVRWSPGRLARPPPCQLRTPYLASVVKSAWEGRKTSFMDS